MPRSSRHKSHRSHKHSSRDATERSDSEDGGRDRRLRLVEAGPGSGARVSRDVEAEKRKASSSPQAFLKKDKGGSENGDFSSGRKRKEREGDSATPDRWNGSGKDDGLLEKVSKEETFGHVDSEKVDKSKVLTAESKSRSSRRREGSTERYVESGNRTESVKRRSEKEHTRREYRDDKEKDINRSSEREKDRERVLERDKKVQDSRHGRSDDVESKSQRSRRGAAEMECNAKKDSTERQARDDLHNAELEKDTETFMTKRRCSSDGNEKGLDDGRNSDDRRLPDDRRLSSRDDYIKNGSHKVEGLKDERYKDDRYRDKYYKDLDRNHRHRDSRHKEERSSRDYISDRLESKSVRDREKYFDSYKKSRLHGSDRELSPHADDHGIKSMGNRLRKRFYDEIDDHYGMRKISTKESRSNVDKDASNSSKFDHRHQGKVDSSLNNTLSRSSLSPKAHSSKEQTRHRVKLAEYTHGEPFSGDRPCPTEDHDKISVVHETVCEPLSSEKAQRRDRVHSDDRERQVVSESPIMENNSQADLQMPEGASASSSLLKRTNHFPASSPGHLIPQSLRRGMDNSSTYEDEMRITSGDGRSNGRYRSCDPSMERAQGGAWKNGPNWSAPLPNGFIPFQHGHAAPGFAIQHFPPPPLFGVRPYVEINQTGIPYHMHEVADRFPGQGHPFGWHHPVDESCPPQIHVWDGGNSLFGDKSQVYRRPDWNRNRHLIGGRGWELNAELSKGQSSSMADFSSPQELTDESRGAYPNLESNTDVENLRHASDAAALVKQLNDPPDNKSVEACLEAKLKMTSEFRKKFSGDTFNLYHYFSKIEISTDLLHPELYKEVKDIWASVNFTDMHNVSKDENAKKNKIQNSRKFPNIRSSLLPAPADSTFKRAMSVYEKQSCRRQLKLPAVAVCSKEVNVSLEATVEDGMRPAITVTKEPSTANNNSAATLMEEADPKTITGDADSSLVHIEVENVENPGDSLKNQSDLNSDVDVLESSQTCEAIMSVCKVNLIRIHNSTENTH